MVDSRAKGARGEILVKDLLTKYTKLNWCRTPLSGALHERYKMKGDIYLPDTKNRFCIEVKNYQESSFNDKILTSKTNNIVLWWTKICMQAISCEQEPLLFFKYDRSKIFVATAIKPVNTKMFVYISFLECYIMSSEEWLNKEKITWIL